jgi:hypothetical protein
MKRRNLNEASIAPCYFSWSVIFFLMVLCCFSCACRNKANSVQLNPVDSSSISETKSEPFVQSYTDPNVLTSNYNQIIQEIKAKPGYSLFAEFLERGKYADVMMRMDKMKYCILVPSDTELRKLDNAKFTQLIYPEISDNTNINFLFSHVASTPLRANSETEYRTMSDNTLTIDSNGKNVNIGGKQFPIIDEVKLPSSIRILFIDNYLN